MPDGSSNHPESPWQAQWCWVRKWDLRPWNRYAYFRRSLRLGGQPTRAVVRVSADARYTLYVNGKRVHHGPARSFPEHQSFDTLDLAEFLRPGDNAICAIVHQFGVPTFQSVYRAASGFIFDGSIQVGSEFLPLHTADGWLCRDAAAWRADVSRLTMQLGFQEHFDADADPVDWVSPAFAAKEEEGWVKPTVLGPVGVHPWLAMEPRGVPLLAHRPAEFQAVVAEFTGDNARGYKIAPDVYHLPAGEERKREKSSLQNPAGFLHDDPDVTTIAPPGDGRFAMAVLDLGQTRTGHVTLDIAQAEGDEIIDIIYTETLDDDSAPLLKTNPEEATADRYRCRPGPQKWEPFNYKGFRYATLIFRNVETKPLLIRHVGLRQVHAGVEEAGSFECSDELLTKIWRTGRDTLLNCMFDAYVDCPSREQAQWWGDARVQFMVNAYTFGDLSLLARGIRQVAQSQSPDGALQSHPPSDDPFCLLPDYMMTWVGSLWDYYFHTGRTQLLSECLPAMHRLFAFFGAHEGAEGLIGSFEGWWVFLDWQKLYKANYSGVLNLMYLQALRWAAAICQVLGDEGAAGQYERKAVALTAAVEKHFWDGKAKVWRDGFDPIKNAPVDEISQHMNALAILLRLKPEMHASVAKDVLLKSARSKRTKILTASPFFYAYVLDALAEAGLRNECIEIIRAKWGAMLDEGATTFWEHWDGKGSRCHAWSAGPVYHLSQQILGVMPVDIGWKEIRISPLPGGLDFARGSVPTPLGPVRVEWEKAAEDQLALRVELPPGMRGEFVSPQGESTPIGPGAHELHT